MAMALILTLLSAAPERPASTVQAPATTPIAQGTVVRNGEPYLAVKYGVDLARLQALPGMPATGRGAWAIEQIRSGRVPSSLQIKALVDISAARRRGILESLLRQEWPTRDFDPTKGEVKSFLDFSGRLLNTGDRFEYRFSGQATWIRFQDEEWRHFTSPSLHHTLLKFNYHLEPTNRDAMKAYQDALGEMLK